MFKNYMLTTIIFDLGGVLIDWNPEYVFREVIPDPERRRYFFENICTHDWNIEQDAGRSLSDATTLLVDQWPEWETEVRTYYGRWAEMLGGPHAGDGGVAARTARSGYAPLAGPDQLERRDLSRRAGALRFPALVRGHRGVAVRSVRASLSPDIYRLLLERYGVPAEEAVFIDDSLKNVEGAEAVGMQGHSLSGC